MGGVGPKLFHVLLSIRGHRLSENVSYMTFSPPKQRPEAVLCYEERLYDVYKEFLSFIDCGRSTRVS